MVKLENVTYNLFVCSFYSVICTRYSNSPLLGCQL